MEISKTPKFAKSYITFAAHCLNVNVLLNKNHKTLFLSTCLHVQCGWICTDFGIVAFVSWTLSTVTILLQSLPDFHSTRASPFPLKILIAVNNIGYIKHPVLIYDCILEVQPLFIYQ